MAVVVHSAAGRRRLDDLGRFSGFLNSQRLKGIHLAIKSGMLAAETAFDAMAKGRTFRCRCWRHFRPGWKELGSRTEFWPVRNFHQGFEGGFLSGMFHAGIQQFTGGRGLKAHYTNERGIGACGISGNVPADGGAEAKIIGPAKGDGKLTFDKLTDLYHSARSTKKISRRISSSTTPTSATSDA